MKPEWASINEWIWQLSETKARDLLEISYVAVDVSPTIPVLNSSRLTGLKSDQKQPLQALGRTVLPTILIPLRFCRQIRRTNSLCERCAGSRSKT